MRHYHLATWPGSSASTAREDEKHEKQAPVLEDELDLLGRNGKDPDGSAATESQDIPKIWVVVVS